MGQHVAGSFARLFGRLTIFLILCSMALVAAAQDYVPGRLIVKFKDGTPAYRQTTVAALYGTRPGRAIPQLGVQVVNLPANAHMVGTMLALRKDKDVEFVEPDWLVPHAQVSPNDPMYSSQSYYTRISAPSAWGLTTGSSSLTVAVLDTGVNSSHPDLIANLVPGRNIYSNNNDTTDLFGHGTNTAGTVAAASNNGIGVASVAWGCKIMPVRINSPGTASASVSDIAVGLIWAADNGARVANLSYAAGGNNLVEIGAQYFYDAGGVVSISAGNFSTNLTYANSPHYLLVGATTPSDTLAGYSNYGTPVDLVAPGDVVTTYLNGGYGGASGTSFSAPLVAGVVALMKSINPSLTPAEITQLINNNCDDLGAAGWDPTFGNGRLNAFKAVQAASGGAVDTTPPTVSFSAPANGATVSGTVNVQVNASDAGGIAEVTLRADGNLVGTDTTAPYEWSWDSTALSNGNHTLQATARDTAGNTNSVSITVNVQNADTTPPTVSFTTPSNGATVSGNVSIQVNASDAGGVSQVTVTVDGVSIGTDTTAPYSWSWNSTAVANGNHTIVATARDNANNTNTATITVNVQNADTTPPTVSITSPSNGSTVSGTVSVSASASDGGGIQNVTLTVDGVSLGTDSTAPYQWSWNTTSLSNGNHVLVATARDNAGNTNTATITVNVQNADTTPPTVSITSPSNGATVSGTITVSASASDAGGIQNVTLTVDGTPLGTDSTAPYQWSWNTASAANGSHVLVATARDNAGNTNTATITVNVNNGDTTPPTITIVKPTGGYIGNHISVLVSASDNVGVTRVELYLDGALIATSTSAPFKLYASGARIPRGLHTMQCKAYDAAGNVGWSQEVVVRR